jgi:accessory gene regulator protein AgrB
MERLINVLIVLAVASFIIAIGVSYGFVVRVFLPGAFYKATIACLTLAITLILLQIRDKK